MKQAGGRRRCTCVRGLALGCVLWLGLASAAEITVTLYNTGDLHEHTDNLARLAAFVAGRKAVDPHVLFVDCGDLLNRGDPAYQITRGEAMLATLAVCGLDAAVMGNHDLSFGSERAVRLFDRFAYPLVDANTVWPDGLRPRQAPPYRRFALPGVSVAILGTASEHINHAADRLTRRMRVPDALLEWLPRARAEADIVVLLTHVGTERDEAIAAALAEAFPGPRPAVDLILGAHDHRAYPELLWHPSGIPIQHSGDHGRYLGETILVWDGTRVVARRSRLIPITPEMPEAPAVVAIRDRYRQALPADRPLLRLEAPADPARLATWLGELVLQTTGVEAVLVPPTMWRKGLPAGAVTAETLCAVLARLEPLCFEVPSLADLQARVVAESDPSRRPYVVLPPAREPVTGPVRVAWYAVAADAPTPLPAAAGPLLTGLPDPRRRPEWSVWDLVVAAAAVTRDAAAPGLVIAAPATGLPPPAGHVPPSSQPGVPP